MKKLLTIFKFLFVAAFLFTSCNKNEISDPFPSELVEGCYIINYGNFGAGGASISKYDYDTDQMTNFYYRTQNGGTELLSNIQYGYSYKDSIFLMGNANDQLITLNPLFKQNLNGITTDIEKPRFCIGSGEYLYISCWGAEPDWSDMPDTYIAKFNIGTRSVEERIPVPGGPEGLAIANGKLYAALNFDNKVAVVNLSDNSVSYITTPAVSSYFVKDKDNNLFFTMLSTFSDYSDETGIGFINTTTDQMETFYSIDNVSTNYGSMIQADPFFTKIYVVTSSYDENWNLTGAVSVFDVASRSFNETNFVENIAGLSGIAVNPVNKDVYVFAAPSVTGAGLMKIYDKDGEFVKEYEVGASPNGAIFRD